jgi:hypothetical protein
MTQQFDLKEQYLEEKPGMKEIFQAFGHIAVVIHLDAFIGLKPPGMIN